MKTKLPKTAAKRETYGIEERTASGTVIHAVYVGTDGESAWRQFRALVAEHPGAYSPYGRYRLVLLARDGAR